MAISPVNVTRISNNLRTTLTLESLRRNQLDLFLSQTRLATGRSFATPSEDPVAAARAVDLSQSLARQDQFRTNAQYGDTFLTAADSALTEINGLLIQASSIASQSVSNLTSEAEREAEAEVVAAIRQQVQTVANRQFNGRYLFAGRNTTKLPFVDAPGGIAYVGDVGELLIRPDVALRSAISMPGSLVFGALSASITSDVDLTPSLLDSTRLDDMSGAAGQTIRGGTLIVNEIGGAGVFTVDLSSANTIGEVVDLINAAAAAAGADVAASLGGTGLVLTPGAAPITVTDTGGGAAVDLGVLTTQQTTQEIVGAALVPRVTRLTPVGDLALGAGIDLDSGLIITNGLQSATIDLSNAQTVQDVINAINTAGVHVLARINDAGTGIDVFNQVSGSSLTIGENGGSTASDLGLRTFDSATPLSQLNFGDGVTTTPNKPDLRIIAKNARTVDVDLDGATTVGEVIARINAAATTATVAVRASFTTTGNGIRIQDTTGGSGSLTVAVLNSDAAFDLGLAKTVSGTVNEIIGDDVNPQRTEGIIGALLDLERSLRDDSTSGISAAGNRLDVVRSEATRTHGIIGARSATMATKRTQMEDVSAATEVFLSEIKDLDYAQAITHMQMATTRLQANLQASSATLNLSLLDFLR